MVVLRSGASTPSHSHSMPKPGSQDVLDRDLLEPQASVNVSGSDHSPKVMETPRQVPSAPRRSTRLSAASSSMVNTIDAKSVSRKRNKGVAGEGQERNVRCRGDDDGNCSSSVEIESGVRIDRYRRDSDSNCATRTGMASQVRAGKVLTGTMGVATNERERNEYLSNVFIPVELNENFIGNSDDGLKVRGRVTVPNERGNTSAQRPEFNPVSDGSTDGISEASEHGNHQSRGTMNQRMEQFRDIARINASRFARGESGNTESSVSVQGSEVEDWPGPFSSAMKIIRDRTNKVNTQRKVDNSEGRHVFWVPKEKSKRNLSRQLVPSLQELCLAILAANAGAISSLEGVPDILKHRLCHMLCTSLNMTGRFFGLLLQGSPSEIRVENCSWLEEDAFINYFKDFDASNLNVLQLDQCGRSVADYSIISTFARLPCGLPVLTTLSLTGAYRLSDNGLKSLVHATPNLISANLSQCSLLTSSSIDILSSLLNSVLRELCINECEGINVNHALPALKKFQCLEMLSLSGIQIVTDDSIKELVSAQGHNLKELALSNCLGLTDASLKAISDSCPRLRSLDLSNLTKLTDTSLGFLANSCCKIRILNASRNGFSDEAIAAYLETSGAFLTELSLNNVAKVDQNTALALAKCARSLSSLDLSWCRRLTDDLLGLVVDSCASLKLLKIFGCSQVTETFYNGHSNLDVQIIGAPMSPLFVSYEADSQKFRLVTE